MGRDNRVQTHFREQLRAERERLGWSQAEMAKALSANGFPLHASAIAKIEAGDRAVRIDEAVAIADALDVELEDMLPSAPNEQSRLRRARRMADRAMYETRGGAASMAAAYEEIIDLLEERPNLYANLRDEDLHFSPTTVDEYLSWVLDRMGRVFHLPEDTERIVVRNPRRIEQLTALIEATVAGVVSDIPFPDNSEADDEYTDELVSRLRHPAVAARLGRGLARLIPDTASEENDDSET